MEPALTVFKFAAHEVACLPHYISYAGGNHYRLCGP